MTTITERLTGSLIQQTDLALLHFGRLAEEQGAYVMDGFPGAFTNLLGVEGEGRYLSILEQQGLVDVVPSFQGVLVRLTVEGVQAYLGLAKREAV